MSPIPYGLIIDFALGIFGSLKTAVFDAEKTLPDGGTKKEKVTSLVYSLIECDPEFKNIDTLDPSLVRRIVSFLIDALVLALKHFLGHDWLKKV